MMLWAADSFFFALYYENIIMLLAGFASRVHFMLIASCYVAYFVSILGRPLLLLYEKKIWLNWSDNWRTYKWTKTQWFYNWQSLSWLSTGCLLGIRDWRILCLLHRILQLTIGRLWLFFIQMWSLFNVFSCYVTPISCYWNS